MSIEERSKISVDEDCRNELRRLLDTTNTITGYFLALYIETGQDRFAASTVSRVGPNEYGVLLDDIGRLRHGLHSLAVKRGEKDAAAALKPLMAVRRMGLLEWLHEALFIAMLIGAAIGAVIISVVNLLT